MQAVLGGFFLLVLGQAPTAPPPIYHAVVIVPEAEVRCGPGTSPKLYATNHLRRNDPVQVVRERGDGWLEILPPPGSFSWINKREVSNPFPNQPHNWVVKADRQNKVPVFIGSDVTPGTRGTVFSVQVPPGYQTPVAFNRSEVSDQEGTWLPIEAPIGEVRFIQATAVSKTGFAVAPGSPYSPSLPPVPPNPYIAAASPIGPPSSPASEADRLLLRAQQAERAGNINEAIQLYSQLASQSSGVSHEQAMLGLNRAYWLKEAQRNAPMPTLPPIQPRVLPATSVSDVRPGNPPVSLAVRTNPPGGSEATSLFTPYSAASPVAPLMRPASSNAAPWQAVTPEGYPSSGPGRLRPAGRMVDGRRCYVLESNENYPRLYCTPHTGIDLEPYLNQNVELFGPAIYKGDMRVNYVTMVRIQTLP